MRQTKYKLNDSKIKLLSKAETLYILKKNLKYSIIEDMYIFTVEQWKKNKKEIIGAVKSNFYPNSVVIRSSSKAEDTHKVSMAGFFHTELDVPTKKGDIVIKKSIESVINSYRRRKNNNNLDQILIQTYTKNTKISGVLFTRQVETNAPYYVINYDRCGKTDAVTGGRDSSVVYISHFVKKIEDSNWAKLIESAKEIEKHFPGMILDIEFAINTNNKVVIFQVRPLAANRGRKIPDNTFVKHLIEDMTRKFKRFSAPVPHLAGRDTIFGDMPDWNPSEIIGSRPNTLDYTLYSYIVTDDIWHEARSSLGYYDVYPSELMVSFGKKPYIDTRASFNSLTPSDMPDGLREKIINYYIKKLKNNLALQDKVEFEILWTCYNFSTEEELKSLYKHNFDRRQVHLFKNSIKNLTNNILSNFDDIVTSDLNQMRLLAERSRKILKSYKRQEKTPWNAFNAAYNILLNCKKYGTFPFSRQARLAFIAKSFLISLRKKQIIDEEFYMNFMNSVKTVASKFDNDFFRLQSNKLDKGVFISNYGHLRAGTYDITSPRYDNSPHLFEKRISKDITAKMQKKFKMAQKIQKGINGIIKKCSLCGNADSLMNFIRISLQNREYTKFEFTRGLSDAMELIAEAGHMLGFSREQLCNADLSTLMKFRNPEYGDFSYAKSMINLSIKRHKKERRWYDMVILPPVLTSENDFYCVSPYKALPNFITTKSVKAKLVKFDNIKQHMSPNIEGKIVLLENADPGFDWIFTKRPGGIVTKYGGVASHMAIRCAEFSIPAAIGCGDVIYEHLKSSKAAILDCERNTMEIINHD